MNTAAGLLISVDKALLVRAFELWNAENRALPEKFITQAEMAEMEVGTLSQCHAITMIAYYRAAMELHAA